MDKIEQDAMDLMRPDGLVADDAPWQQRKSANMRIRILESTIDCLVEKGYASLSTNEIVQRTGVSRGAMHHHFTNRMALVAAVIEYILYQRLHQFLENYTTALRRSKRSSFVAVATELHWRTVQSREYAAYLELAMAARTDEELGEHFFKTVRKFDRVWQQEMKKSFPEWEARWDEVQVASDFAMAAHLGLLMNRKMFGERRTRAVRDLVSDVVIGIYAEHDPLTSETDSQSVEDIRPA